MKEYILGLKDAFSNIYTNILVVVLALIFASVGFFSNGFVSGLVGEEYKSDSLPPVSPSVHPSPSPAPQSSPSTPKAGISTDQSRGVVKDPSVWVLTEPSEDAPRISDALLGEDFKVIGYKGKWIHVQLYQQDIEGWIDAGATCRGRLYSPHTPRLMVNVLYAPVYRSQREGTVPILNAYMGSILELEGSPDASPLFYRILLPDGNSAWIKKKNVVFIDLHSKENKKVNYRNIISSIEQMKNVPYQRGGMTPLGMDSDGLIHIVYRCHGIKLHRDIKSQFEKDGSRVETSSLEGGDIIFFTDSSGKIAHGGIYLGQHQFLHASPGSGIVTVSRMNTPYYSSRFAGVKRIIEN